MSTGVYCWIPSGSGIRTGCRIVERLAVKPWISPDGAAISVCHLFLPQRRLANLHIPDRLPPVCLCAEFGASFREAFKEAAAHVFVGACGIAVRLAAPCLRHKSLDPPIIVIDPGGKFAISLLSGHWGGGNWLATHLAELLGAIPVITTESDIIQELSLDTYLQDRHIKILDWQRLPAAQAALNAGEKLFLLDPLKLLPACKKFMPCPNKWQKSGDVPTISLDWRKQRPKPRILRIAPCLHVGIGYRKNVHANELLTGLKEFLRVHGVEERAISNLATVMGKGPELQPLAQLYAARLAEFPASELAGVTVPHPSEACASRFAQKPFSVCEGAAILSAGGEAAKLLAPKFIWRGKATFALAMRTCPEAHKMDIINA